MELVANGGLTGWGVIAFLAVVSIQGVWIVPLIDWAANRWL